MKKSNFTMVLLGLLLFSINSTAQNQLGTQTSNYFDSSIKEGELSNGIRYIIWKHDIPKGIANFYTFYKNGAIQEEPNEYGLAHIIEHIGFSPNTEADTLLSCFLAKGLKNGYNLNAKTGWDQTQFRVIGVPTQRESLIDSVFTFLSIFPCQMEFSPKRVEKQRRIILEEWSLNPLACSKTVCDMALTSFMGNRYSRIDMVGDSSVINNFTIQDLKTYYNKWYNMNDLIIIAIGDFDTDKIEKSIQHFFGCNQSENKVFSVAEHSIPNIEKQIINITSDPSVFSNRLEVHYKLKNKIKDPQIQLREKYINAMISFMFNKRLTEITYNLNAPFFYARTDYNSSFFNAIIYDEYLIQADTYDDIKPALSVIETECGRIIRHGFTAKELDLAKEIVKQWSNLSGDKYSLPNDELYIKLYYYILDGEIPFSIPFMRNFEHHSLFDITLDEVNEKMKEDLSQSPPIILLKYKESKVKYLPSQEEIGNLLNDIRTSTIPPYSYSSERDNLMDSLPSSGHIIQEQENGEIGTTEWVLSNGVKVIFKPTEFSEEEVRFSVIRNNNNLKLKPEYLSTLNFRPDIMGQMGVGDISKPELDNYLKNKKIAVYPYFNESIQKLQGSCSIEYLEEAFQLTYLYFTAPRFNKNVLNGELERSLGTGNSNFVLRDSINRITVKNNSRYYAILNKDLISTEKLRDIYQLIYGNPADFTFFIAGTIDKNKLINLINKYIGSIESTSHNYKEIIDLNPMTKKDWWNVNRQSRIIKTLTNIPSASVYVCCQGAYINNTLLPVYRDLISTLFINRCTEILREKEQATYSVHPFWADYNDYDSYLQFSAFFKTKSPKAEYMKDIALREMKYVFDGNIAESEFVEVKNEIIKQREAYMKSNDWWVNMALPSFYIKKKKVASTYINEVRTISIDDVKKIMRLIYNQNNIVDIIMVPNE